MASSTTTRRAISRSWRIFNALCYLVSGISMLVVGGSVGFALLGCALAGYGLYVALANRSYWVGTYTYIIPFVGVAILFAK